MPATPYYDTFKTHTRHTYIMLFNWPPFTTVDYEKTMEDFYTMVESSSDVTIYNEDEVLFSDLDYADAAESLRSINDSFTAEDVEVQLRRDLGYKARINGEQQVTVEGSYDPLHQ